MRCAGAGGAIPRREDSVQHDSSTAAGEKRQYGASAVKVAPSLISDPAGRRRLSAQADVDKPASAMTPKENCSVPCTINSATKLGRMCSAEILGTPCLQLVRPRCSRASTAAMARAG